MGLPDFGPGAMENWGLVLYKERYLLYDDIVSSINDKWLVTNIIAHELAHQVLELARVYCSSKGREARERSLCDKYINDVLVFPCYCNS